MAAPTVGIIGLRALTKDINRMATEVSGPLYTQIKQAGRQAALPVAERARSALPHITGRLAGDIRVSATRTGAAIRMGRASVPYAGWVEFGGSLPSGAEREYRPGGRYLFPAAQALAETAAAQYSAALERVLNSPQVWTNTSGSAGSVHD